MQRITALRIPPRARPATSSMRRRRSTRQLHLRDGPPPPISVRREFVRALSFERSTFPLNHRPSNSGRWLEPINDLIAQIDGFEHRRGTIQPHEEKMVYRHGFLQEPAFIFRDADDKGSPRTIPEVRYAFGIPFPILDWVGSLEVVIVI